MARVPTSNAEPPSVNLISRGTTVVGNIETDTDIRISGSLEGELTANARTIISESGKVVGKIFVDEAVIAGNVDGEVRVKGLLTLKGSAVIDGEVHSGRLVVEEGATFNGKCQMGVVENVSTNAAPAPPPDPVPQKRTLIPR